MDNYETPKDVLDGYYKSKPTKTTTNSKAIFILITAAITFLFITWFGIKSTIVVPPGHHGLVITKSSKTLCLKLLPPGRHYVNPLLYETHNVKPGEDSN